jgi:hypothetical protein
LAFTPQGLPSLALVDPDVSLNPAGLAVTEERLYIASPQSAEVVAYPIPTLNTGGP